MKLKKITFVFIFILLLSACSDTAVMSLNQGESGQNIKALQSQLRSFGYYKGVADGFYDEATQAALIAFQEQNGIDPNEGFNIETAEKLGITPNGKRTANTSDVIPAHDRYLELKDIAKAFLRQSFKTDFYAANVKFNKGCAVIEFTPIYCDIALYTDSVVVRVDISSGEIIETDSHNFLTNNKNRYISNPKISQEEAREKLNGDFNVESCRLALIRTQTEDEVLCYEFAGNISANAFLVYINANTGQEEIR